VRESIGSMVSPFSHVNMVNSLRPGCRVLVESDVGKSLTG
jgi:hypothetical protein